MSINRISSPQNNSGYDFRKNQKVHIRWMIRCDMPRVLEIEDYCSQHPWSDEEFLHVLRQRTCIGMVAEFGETIVGFIVYNLNKKGIEILNFATCVNFQRMGVGCQMIDKLKDKLSKEARTYLQVFVRETNLNSQKFLQANGFKARTVIREHFEDTGEDSYLMRYRLK